jgi:hypothetical protein
MPVNSCFMATQPGHLALLANAPSPALKSDVGESALARQQASPSRSFRTATDLVASVPMSRAQRSNAGTTNSAPYDAPGRRHITPSSVSIASSGKSSGLARSSGRKPCVKLTPTVTGRGFRLLSVRSKKPPP